MKKLLVLLLMAALVMSLCLTSCGSKEEAPAEEPAQEEEQEQEEEQPEEPVVDATKYGYGGEDPVEAAIYKYLVEEVAKKYPEADVSIPVVIVVHEDLTDENDSLAFGDYWIYNYKIDGDTLKTQAGGNHPGVMHLKKEEDGNYTVTEFEETGEGGDFEPTAKELFGEHFEDFMNVYSNSDTVEEARKITVSDYVNLNGLDDVKYYQDEGWDPVELYKQ